MNVEIILNDENGNQALIISNSKTERFVNLTFIGTCETTEVSIDELRIALRKLVAK